MSSYQIAQVSCPATTKTLRRATYHRWIGKPLARSAFDPMQNPAMKATRGHLSRREGRIATVEAVIDDAIRLDDAGEPRRALERSQPLLQNVALQATRPAAAGRALYAAGQCEVSLGNYLQCDRYAMSALKFARHASDVALEAGVLTMQAQARYHQGDYADCLLLAEQSRTLAESAGLKSRAAEACIPALMAHVGRAQFEHGARIAADGVALAEVGGDALIRAQLLNASGLFHYYRGLSRILPVGIAVQVTLIDEADALPARDDFARANADLNSAIAITAEIGATRFRDAMRANQQRILVLCGQAEGVTPFLKTHIRNTHRRGLLSDEISARNTYAWALRLRGHYAESLAEVDAALQLSCNAGCANRLVEVLLIQRSTLLAAMGETSRALEPYRQYSRRVTGDQSRIVGERNAATGAPAPSVLEPFYLKRAEQILDSSPHRVPLEVLAACCGVSARTLQMGFKRFRGVSPITHGRNRRLDRARINLDVDGAIVADVALASGFKSVTTFSYEFRRRFGITPRDFLIRNKRVSEK
jgi:AraC-like DNA-binding protein